jgi:hypothetical protein
MVAAFSLAAWDGSAFEIEICAPVISLFAALVLPGVATTLWLCRVPSRANYGICLAAALVFSAFLFVNSGTRVRSEPEHDFVRYVLQGPHYEDEDKEAGYNVAEHHLPDTVRVLRSRTFETSDDEGCTIYFSASPSTLADLIKLNQLEPTSDAQSLERLDRKASWYLHVRAEDLATPPRLYARNPPTGIENWLLATNAAGDRAIFVFLNVN